MSESNENLSAGEAVAPVAPVAEKRKNTPRNEFCKVWQQSNSAREVAEKLGMSPATASSTASKYREDGFILKIMPKGGGVRLTPESTYLALAEINGTTVEQEKQKAIDFQKAKEAKAAEKAAAKASS